MTTTPDQLDLTAGLRYARALRQQVAGGHLPSVALTAAVCTLATMAGLTNSQVEALLDQTDVLDAANHALYVRPPF